MPLDADVHLVLCSFGRAGLAYVEADPAESDASTIVRNLLYGRYGAGGRNERGRELVSGRVGCDGRRGTRSRSARGHGAYGWNVGVPCGSRARGKAGDAAVVVTAVRNQPFPAPQCPASRGLCFLEVEIVGAAGGPAILMPPPALDFRPNLCGLFFADSTRPRRHLNTWNAPYRIHRLHRTLPHLSRRQATVRLQLDSRD
jgi:hypothetical protein